MKIKQTISKLGRYALPLALASMLGYGCSKEDPNKTYYRADLYKARVENNGIVYKFWGCNKDSTYDLITRSADFMAPHDARHVAIAHDPSQIGNDYTTWKARDVINTKHSTPMPRKVFELAKEYVKARDSFFEEYNKEMLAYKMRRMSIP